MRRSWVPVAVLWLGYTVLMMWAVAQFNWLPEQWAIEAEVVDEAMVLLQYLGAPVMALVLAVMTWALIAWRSNGANRPDGPPQRDNRTVLTTWLIVTSALAIFVVINPGFVGLAEIRGEPSADYVIEVEAAQFFWKVTYPNGTESFDELVVPSERRVRYDVTSVDVNHSFWIPAFRIKIDAVAGLTTQAFATAEHEGGIDDDINLRIQCAELCGAGHASMAMPVRVVSDQEFNEYIETLGEGE
ncbi:MAG: cytochrome c oxidase subunit II [Acidimicrobiia bacterium]|nr:cytochrome c oxidase subunit II [Acidimicrobiia bacterium]